jgi:hypothetical protein
MYPAVSGRRFKRYIWLLWTAQDGGDGGGGESVADHSQVQALTDLLRWHGWDSNNHINLVGYEIERRFMPRAAAQSVVNIRMRRPRLILVHGLRTDCDV